jgi:glycosyltransferase involved in cell wall biosynthesis
MDLSKKLHIPFVFDMRGFWPDERVEGGIWNLKNPLYKFLYQYFKKKELQLLNSAAHIITLTHSSKNILEHKFEVKPHKISVIPCAADLDFFQHPGDEVRDKFRQKLGIKSDEKVLLYVGSVGTFYLTSEIFTFYKCKPKNLLCRLVFFSPEHSHNYIHSLIQKFELNASECIVQYVNREDLTHYLSIGDLSVIFIKPSFSKQASSPTKHGELTAMHIPCVVNKNVGDMEMIVSEKPTGYVLNDFSEKEMQKAWDYITQTKFNSSDFDFIAQKYYALDKGIVTYKDIYFKTINNRA